MKDRLPPHAPEAEQAILGCILLAPNEALAAYAGRLRAGLFYDLRHQTICDTLLGMWDSREPIDLVTVLQKLTDSGKLWEVGGLSYLSSLPDQTPSAANAEYYLDILSEKHLLRRMIATGTTAAARAYAGDAEPAELLDQFEREALAIRTEHDGNVVEVDKRATVRALTDEYEAALTGSKTAGGLRTGFYDLDRLTGGLKPQQLVIIAGRPGKGKTSLALNIAEHVALDHGVPAAFISLEMSGKELIHRLITGRARVDGAALNRGEITQNGLSALTLAAAKLVNAPLYIIDKGGLTVAELRGLMRRMVQQHGIKLGVVDYLGLLLPGQRTKSLYESVTYVSAALKALAKELAIPLIVPAQLNRDNDRENRAPRLSDLRDSGGIEQDADIVGLLHDGDRRKGDEDYGQYELRVAKHRNGPIGKIALTFFPERTRFESAAKISDEDVPN